MASRAASRREVGADDDDDDDDAAPGRLVLSTFLVTLPPIKTDTQNR